jgi:hypothetical protein
MMKGSDRTIVTAVHDAVTGTTFTTARIEERCEGIPTPDSHEDPGLSHPRWIDVHGY